MAMMTGWYPPEWVLSFEEGVQMNARHRHAAFGTLVVFLWMVSAGPSGASPVDVPPATSTEGYVARLLINEVPFPGERGYKSEEDTMAAMEQLLMVLDRRLGNVPPPYTQRQIAATVGDDIIDIITVGGEKGQFDGFYRDAQGRPAMVPRVGERYNNLVSIASKGQPGKFARLLNHAGSISTAYIKAKSEPTDRHAPVKIAQGAPATGGAYSWMTDEVRYHPGGNFLRIEDRDLGSLGGNRFFTLRKEPK
jgi:hypothetical protein